MHNASSLGPLCGWPHFDPPHAAAPPPPPIQPLQAAFASQFTTCAGVAGTHPCDCGSDEQAGVLVASPEFTFVVGTWWFTTGASQILGHVCGDLRLDADVGLGEWAGWTSWWFPGTGFYRSTACIFGFATDPGVGQRVDYYVQARQFFDPSFLHTCDDGVVSGGEVDVDWCVAAHAPCIPPCVHRSLGR